jgi:hypothetical protein
MPVESITKEDSESAPQKFHQVPLTSLRLDTVTDFDLYIKPEPLFPPVLYRERNLPFTGDVIERLTASSVKNLFVSDGQEELYRRYVEENLSTIIADKNMQVVERAQIL